MLAVGWAPVKVGLVETYPSTASTNFSSTSPNFDGNPSGTDGNAPPLAMFWRKNPNGLGVALLFPQDFGDPLARSAADDGVRDARCLLAADRLDLPRNPRSPFSAKMGSVDEKYTGYQMSAPGSESSARSYDCPGDDKSFPRVDDYRTDIDFESQEMIGGVVYDVMSADLPHARRNGHLDYLLQGLAAPGYGAASDLKTRVDWDSDFASDSALVKEGTDPQSGTRHLEEIAFEVVHKQSRNHVTKKAPRMIRRGVRRVFAVFVKKGEVAEWSLTSNDWVTLHPSSVIEDPILVEPIEVAAVLDAAKADDAVVRGLAAKGNPEILRIREEGKAEGQIEALRQAVLSALQARSLEIPEAVRDAVLTCDDLVVLDRWFRAAVTAARADDVLDF